MMKKFLACFLAFFLCFISVNSVSAEEEIALVDSDTTITDIPADKSSLEGFGCVFSSNYQYYSQTLSYLNQLSRNSTIDMDDMFFFRATGSNPYLIGVSFSHLRVFDEDDDYIYYTSVIDSNNFYPRIYLPLNSSPSDVSSFDASYIYSSQTSSFKAKTHIDGYVLAFALSKKQPQSSLYFYSNPLSSYNSYNIETTFKSKMSSASHSVTYYSNRVCYQINGDSGFFYRSPIINNPLPEVEKTYDRLGIDVEGLVQYIIFNEPTREYLLSNIPASFQTLTCPLETSLTSLFNYYDSYGGDLNNFILHSAFLKKIIFQMDDNTAVTRDQYNQWLYVLAKCYSNYKKSKLMILPDYIPVSMDDDTLVTDLDDDTHDISLLREIVRLNTMIYNTTRYGYYDMTQELNTVVNNTNDHTVTVDNYDSDIFLDMHSDNIDISNNMLGVLNNIAGLAVMNNDLTANLNTALTDMSLTLNDISEDVNVNNDISDKLDTVNMSITNLSYNAGGSDGSGGSDSSGSLPDVPELPQAEFDNLFSQSGDFFKFWSDLIEASGWLPVSLFTSAAVIALFMRVWGR